MKSLLSLLVLLLFSSALLVNGQSSNNSTITAPTNVTTTNVTTTNATTTNVTSNATGQPTAGGAIEGVSEGGAGGVLPFTQTTPTMTLMFNKQRIPVCTPNVCAGSSSSNKRCCIPGSRHSCFLTRCNFCRVATSCTGKKLFYCISPSQHCNMRKTCATNLVTHETWTFPDSCIPRFGRWSSLSLPGFGGVCCPVVNQCLYSDCKMRWFSNSCAGTDAVFFPLSQATENSPLPISGGASNRMQIWRGNKWWDLDYCNVRRANLIWRNGSWQTLGNFYYSAHANGMSWMQVRNRSSIPGNTGSDYYVEMFCDQYGFTAYGNSYNIIDKPECICFHVKK